MTSTAGAGTATSRLPERRVDTRSGVGGRSTRVTPSSLLTSGISAAMVGLCSADTNTLGGELV